MRIFRDDGSHVHLAHGKAHSLSLQEIEIKHLADELRQDSGTLRDESDHVRRLLRKLRCLAQHAHRTSYHCDRIAKLVGDIVEESRVVTVHPHHPHTDIQTVDEIDSHQDEESIEADSGPREQRMRLHSDEQRLRHGNPRSLLVSATYLEAVVAWLHLCVLRLTAGIKIPPTVIIALEPVAVGVFLRQVRGDSREGNLERILIVSQDDRCRGVSVIEGAAAMGIVRHHRIDTLYEQLRSDFLPLSAPNGIAAESLESRCKR